jgi:hypothetical protein
MKKIAVDIVILFSDEINNKIIELNEKLISNTSPFKLNKKDCFPHISLCMTSINGDDLVNIKSIISNLNKDFLPFNLSASKVVINDI